MSSEPNDKKIEEKTEDVADWGGEDELTLACIISNLASAMENLSEIDSALLNKKRQDDLAMMKRKIFDSLVGFASHLPEWDNDKEKNKE